MLIKTVRNVCVFIRGSITRQTIITVTLLCVNDMPSHEVILTEILQINLRYCQLFANCRRELTGFY